MRSANTTYLHEQQQIDKTFALIFHSIVIPNDCETLRDRKDE